MSTLVAEVRAQGLVVTEDGLIVDLSDGRSITVPLAWFPRLVHGTAEERSNWKWIADRKNGTLSATSNLESRVLVVCGTKVTNALSSSAAGMLSTKQGRTFAA